MKIENFALDINSQQLTKGSVKGVFENELVSFRTQNETQFLKVLEYQMVRQFIVMLQTNSISKQDIAQTPTIKVQERSVGYEYYKNETLDVAMKGYVQTDSQKIALDINLSFSHTYMEKAHMIKAQFYDPLVISFDGELPDLESKTFNFDIDLDGEKDQLSLLKKGNGFLALDKNENGIIDDGTELFGAHNGNGFYDLKRYDSDHNGWIDENDPILDGLRVWIKDKDEDRLVGLGEVGIGALYLGFSQGNYNIRAEDNEILGRISSNGLYLNEDGTSGLLTQIDLARRSEQKQESVLVDILQTT